MSDRLRTCSKTAAHQQVGSRSRYRQQALAGQPSSSASSSSLISISDHHQTPSEMLAALDEARLDAEEVSAPGRPPWPPPLPQPFTHHAHALALALSDSKSELARCHGSKLITSSAVLTIRGILHIWPGHMHRRQPNTGNRASGTSF